MVGERTVQIACDIGGTFTDLVAQVSDGQAHVRKIPSTPTSPGQAVIKGLQQLLGDLHLSFSDVTEVVHGTTVGSNIILQKQGGKTGLITTQGFRDVLEIGRIRTPTMFDVAWDKPVPLVPRRYRLEVVERMGADGEIVVPLDEASVIAAGARLIEEGIETTAVCFLHSCINSEHERHARDLLRQSFPGLRVTASCDVLPEIKEYERTSTTVVNAYLLPGMQRYLESLAKELADAGMKGPILVIASSGGMMKIETAMEKPVFAVGSGPAGGVIGSMRLARMVDCLDAIAFDMGGTTAKATLVERFEPDLVNTFEVARMYRFKKGSGFPVSVPSVDLVEIGAGGGRLARVAQFGLLKVGPESSGAEPGPACYGQGGIIPAVTDADLALGMLEAEGFLGGDMPLDASLSTEALESVSDDLGMSVLETAAGIHEVVNQNMAAAARMHGVERGIDLRGVTVLAFGGAGPVHACGVADLLESDRVVFPVNASVLSAFGTLVSPVRIDLARSMPRSLNDLDVDERDDLLEELRDEGRRVLMAAGVAEHEVGFRYGIDVRYVGQGNEITVWVDEGESWTVPLADVRAAFEQEYKNIYGLAIPDVGIEVVTWRIAASAEAAPVEPAMSVGERAGRDGPAFTRPVMFDRGSPAVDTPVYRRSHLAPGQRFDGPAVVEERETTSVIRPGWSVEVAGDGSLMATRVTA